MAAIYARGWLEGGYGFHSTVISYAVSSALASIVLLWWMGVSRAIWCYFVISDASKAFQAIGLGIGVGLIAGFADNRLEGIARSIPFIQLALQGIMFVAVRNVAQKMFTTKKEPPAKPLGVLVVGCNRTAEAYIRAVDLLSAGTLEIAGILSEHTSMVGLTLRGKKILGTVGQAQDVVKTLRVHGIDLDKIVIAVPESDRARPEFAELDRVIYDQKLAVMQVDNLFGSSRDTDAEAPAAHPEVTGAFGRYAPLKAAIDILGSSVLLVLTAPLFVLVAGLTLLDIGRPIYFWQRRMGRRGRGITLYKFRTMRSPLGRDGEVLDDSQRTSAIGRFLRKTRLDELPQLLHIFNGEMSFIGPRPLLPIDQPEAVLERLSVRPGLTGWAQVHGGKLVTAEEKGALDLYYVAHANLWMDIRIVWLTLRMFAQGDHRDMSAIITAQHWLEMRENGSPVANGHPPRDLSGDRPVRPGEMLLPAE